MAYFGINTSWDNELKKWFPVAEEQIQQNSKVMEVHDYLQGEPSAIILRAKTKEKDQ